MLYRQSKFFESKFKVFLAVTIFSASCVFAPYIPLVQGVDIKQEEATKRELKEKQKALESELQSSKNSIKKESDKKSELDRQIKIVEAQIDTSNKYIFALEEEIGSLEKTIEGIQAQMGDRIDLLKESLRSIYVAGDTSAIDIILQAKTFEDFLDKSQLVKSVSSSISDIIGQLNEDLKRIEMTKKEIEGKKKEAEAESEELEQSQKELQSLMEESEAIIAELQESEQEVQNQLDENDEELQKIEQEIQHYYEQQRIIAERKKREEEERKAREAAKKKSKPSKTSQSQSQSVAVASPTEDVVVTSSSGFAWPVPGYHYISSGYYDTSNRSSMHGAIDIAGGRIYGARVVAADDGEVILTNAGGWGGGYGTYAIVDHGNGKSTLYAHLSNLNVHKGQTVKKGQVIGCVGSSGFSTGPHLHFETRLYGKKYNPMNEYK